MLLNEAGADCVSNLGSQYMAAVGRRSDDLGAQTDSAGKVTRTASSRAMPQRPAASAQKEATLLRCKVHTRLLYFASEQSC